MLIALLLQFQGNALGEVAYWSFQKTIQREQALALKYRLIAFPDGTPVLSGTGSNLTNLGNYGASWTTVDQSHGNRENQLHGTGKTVQPGIPYR